MAFRADYFTYFIYQETGIYIDPKVAQPSYYLLTGLQVPVKLRRMGIKDIVQTRIELNSDSKHHFRIW
ncbi:hypothetical protein [Lactobacillus selangorensis]|uniref:hypothetical protein n=1 Tax=Lactobacillus selangorensis TaxID=81857 RepID=UPI000708AF68|nr:hypothetical protein [Lactobacillus selangorensis]